MAGDDFDYLGKVKLLLGISDASKDEILGLLIEKARQSVLNYCNIKEIPPALNYTLCQVVVDVYRENEAKNGNATGGGAVSSISEDGRSVSFASVSAEIAVEDKISRLQELSKYKKVFRLK